MDIENGVKSPISIFLIEDNEGDIFLTQKAFASSKVPNFFTVAKDGEIAIKMLREGLVNPDLILMDINLPKKDGKQILIEVKGDPELCKTPIIVLTSSKAEKDVLDSYNLHASAYVQKPQTLDRLHEMVSFLETFWCEYVSLMNLVVQEQEDAA